MTRPEIQKVSPKTLEQFCKRYGIRRLASFGSVLRDDFGPESDIDIQKLIVVGEAASHLPINFREAHPEIEWPDLKPALRRRISEAAWAVSLEKELVITTFGASTEAIQNGPLAADPILKSINREGIPV